MGIDAAEVVEKLPCPNAMKVHHSMCTELLRAIDRISKIFPEIEAARPRCSSGIQALCSLNNAIEKATLLIRQCSESSKLYLAITGDVILSRCNRSKNLMEQSLDQIQNMVPVMLAAEISRIVADLRAATISLDSSELEAGKVLRIFLQKYSSAADSTEQSAVEAIQFAASALNITSQKALLIEKRSIKQLLYKVDDSQTAKRQILSCLLNLLKKYGQLIVCKQKNNTCAQHEKIVPFAATCDQSLDVSSPLEHGVGEVQADNLSKYMPPEEFKCPISSRLMFDPVIIASGQTFERIWIQKWFDEGHNTCPKTKNKLTDMLLTPNTSVRELISKWGKAHGVTIPDPRSQLASTAVQSWETSSTSISSLNNSMNNLRLPVDCSGVSIGSLDNSYSSDSSCVKMTNGLNLISAQNYDDCHRFHHYAHNDADVTDLYKLDALSWDSQCQVVEDVKIRLKDDNQACHSLVCEKFVEQLLRFLKNASNLRDLEAKRAGLQLLLTFVSKCRHGIQYLHEDAYTSLASFLDSEVIEEALGIIEVLSCHQNCSSKIAASGALASILNILDTRFTEYLEASMKILYNMSLHDDICSLTVYLECIPKVVPLLDDIALQRYCIMILKNLCSNKDARDCVAETDGFIASIIKVLEIENNYIQELAVTVLLSLCSQHVTNCKLVMDEGVIPSLVSISINGNEKGKATALELLRLLRDADYSDEQECSLLDPVFTTNYCNPQKEKKSSSKATSFFRMKISIFSKPSALAPKKKK